MGQSILTTDQQQLLAIILKSQEITTQFYAEESLNEAQILSWVQQTAKKLGTDNLE